LKLGTITDYVGKVIAEPRAPSPASSPRQRRPSLKKSDNIADLGVPRQKPLINVEPGFSPVLAVVAAASEAGAFPCRATAIYPGPRRDDLLP